MDATVIITTVISAGLPTLITVLTSLWNNRLSRKHAAKQSILQMIMEDEFRYESFGKIPSNYGNILSEYETYHKNGGNGEITLRVDDYKEWYADIERANLDNKRKKS